MTADEGVSGGAVVALKTTITPEWPKDRHRAKTK